MYRSGLAKTQTAAALSSVLLASQREAEEQAHARKRQMIETVFQRLLEGLRLARDRPRTEQGFTARLAAKCALANGLILWNRTEHRPDLAFASVIGW